MRFGPKCPIDEGFLPVFSVASEEEAKRLLVMACPRNAAGEFIAPELATAQTLDNLAAFGDRLRRLHDEHLKGTPRCGCTPKKRGRK